MDEIGIWLAKPSIQRVLTLVATLIVALVVSRLLRTALLNRAHDIDSKYRIRKAIKLLTFLLLLIAVLIVYSDKLGGIGVALGVAGAGVAFALQEVIVSIAGWVLIITTNIIKVGQRVQISGIKGDVIDIGVLKTTLMEVGEWVGGDLYNGRIVTVANSFAFKEPVFNYSGEYPFLWDEILVPIRHGSDHEEARKLFQSILEDICGDFARQSADQWHVLTDHYRVEKARVEPMVNLVFNENWITFNLRYIVDYKHRRSVRDAISTSILNKLKDHQGRIEIAYSTLEVTLNPSLPKEQ